MLSGDASWGFSLWVSFVGLLSMSLLCGTSLDESVNYLQISLDGLKIPVGAQVDLWIGRYSMKLDKWDFEMQMKLSTSWWRVQLSSLGCLISIKQDSAGTRVKLVNQLIQFWSVGQKLVRFTVDSPLDSVHCTARWIEWSWSSADQPFDQ